MKNKKEKSVYKSFEQLRSELFPNLIFQENVNQVKKDSEQFGNCLANKAVDRMLSSFQN